MTRRQPPACCTPCAWAAVAICGGACRLQGKEKELTTPHRRETIAARNRPAGVDGWEDAAVTAQEREDAKIGQQGLL
jgi:hypothetical protein